MSAMREFHGQVFPDGRVQWDFPAQVIAWRRKLAGGSQQPISAAFYEFRSKRSDRQNRALWALLNAWCEEAEQGWRPDDLKDAVMAHVFGTIEATNPLTGVVTLVPAVVRTSSLNVSEFCKVIESILELAATSEPSVFLESPDEYRKAKQLADRKRDKIAERS